MLERTQSAHRSPVAKVAGAVDIQSFQQLGVTMEGTEERPRGGRDER
jgi:hypothetical protein